MKIIGLAVFMAIWMTTMLILHFAGIDVPDWHALAIGVLLLVAYLFGYFEGWVAAIKVIKEAR